MKEKLTYLIIPILLVLGYFLLNYSLPKYTGQYLSMVILFLADIYLWSSVQKQVFSYRIWLKLLVTFVYWLPLILVVFLMVGGTLLPLVDWNDVFRTYLLGFILVFYTAKMLPVIFLLMADIIRVIDRIFKLVTLKERQKINEEQQGITRSKFLQYLGFLSGGLVMGTMFTGMFKWVYQFKVVKESLKFAHLPAEFDGFKIVQISDMHLGSWTSRKPLDQAVEMINQMDPDLILFTGDLVNFSTREAFRFEDSLKRLKAKQGIYATLGNHDYGDYVKWDTPAEKEENMHALFAFFKRIGWDLLNNENRLFKAGEGTLALLGVENWGANLRFPRHGRIEDAFAGTEAADVRILMTHDPSHWEKVVVPEKYDIDLSLSGHTHGFQFGIETKDVKWSPAKYLYKYWAGLYKDPASERYLYVNRGLGSIGYPGRIGILPEITLIELNS